MQYLGIGLGRSAMSAQEMKFIIIAVYIIDVLITLLFIQTNKTAIDD